MNIIRSILATFAWNVVKHTGPWVYQENGITRYRRAISTGYGHQPVDLDWLRRRASIKPVPPGTHKRKTANPPSPPDDTPGPYGWSRVCFDLNGDIVA